MNWIGIDPGLHGALAVIGPEGLIEVVDTPVFGGPKPAYDDSGMSQLLFKYRRDATAVLEAQQAFPKQGGVSTFTTGYGYGLWRGLLTAHGIPCYTVRHREWKKYYDIGADKAEAVARASRLFSGGDFIGPRGGLLDGRAEACLIAEYGRRLYG